MLLLSSILLFTHPTLTTLFPILSNLTVSILSFEDLIDNSIAWHKFSNFETSDSLDSGSSAKLVQCTMQYIPNKKGPHTPLVSELYHSCTFETQQHHMLQRRWAFWLLVLGLIQCATKAWHKWPPSQHMYYFHPPNASRPTKCSHI